MTDYSNVKKELSNLLDLTDSEIEKYDSQIAYAVNCVKPLIKADVDENDVRLVHLCAIKAYYQIVLMQLDSVSSFSAGEVSYSMDTSSSTKAKMLLDEALSSCKDLIDTSAFAFKAV